MVIYFVVYLVQIKKTEEKTAKKNLEKTAKSNPAHDKNCTKELPQKNPGLKSVIKSTTEI